MARELTIRINVDTANAKQQVDALVAQLKALGVQTQTSASASQSSARATRQQSDAHVQAYKAIEKQRREQDRQAESLRKIKYITDIEAAGARGRNKIRYVAKTAISQEQRELEKLNREQASAANAAARATKATDRQAQADWRFTQQLRKRNQALAESRMNLVNKQMQEFQSSTDAARRTAYSMTIAGGQLAAVGYAIQRSFKAVNDVFEGYDFALRRAAGAMEVYTSGTLKDLGTAVEKLAIETKLFNPEEVAMGLYYWGSATGQVIEGTEDINRLTGQMIDIMKMAGMTEIGLEEATKGVVGILQQFRLEMDSANKVTRDMTYIAQKTAVEVSDLINTMTYVGPVAAQWGVAYEDMLKLAGAIGNAGIKGSRFGRAMRQVFSRLVKEPKEATKTLDYLSNQVFGMDWSEAIFPEGKFIGIREYLNKLSEMYQQLDQDQQKTLLGQMATQNELPVLEQLLVKNSEALAKYGKNLLDVTEYTGDLNDANRYFEEAWRLMSESARATYQEFRNKLMPLFNELGQAILDVVKPVLEVVGALAQWVASIAEAHPMLTRLGVAIMSVVAAFAALGGSVLIYLGFARLLTHAVIPNLLAGFVKTRLEMAASNLSLLTAARGMTDTAGRADALRMSIAALKDSYRELGLAATAKTAGLAVLGRGPEQNKQLGMFDDAPVVVTRGNAVARVADMVKGAFSRLGGAMKWVLSMGRNYIGVITKVGAAIGIWAVLIGGAVKALGGGNKAMEKFLDVGKKVLDIVLSPFKLALDATSWAVTSLGDLFDDITDVASGPMWIAFHNLGEIIYQIGNIIDGVVGKISDTLDWAGGIFNDWIGQYVPDIVGGAQDALDTVSDTYDSWVDDELTKYRGRGWKLRGAIEGMADTMNGAVKKASEIYEKAASGGFDDNPLGGLDWPGDAEEVVAEVEKVLIDSKGNIMDAAKKGIRDPIRWAIKDINAGEYLKEEIDDLVTGKSQLGKGISIELEPKFVGGFADASGGQSFFTQEIFDTRGTAENLQLQFEQAWEMAIGRFKDSPKGLIPAGVIKFDDSTTDAEFDRLINNIYQKMSKGGRKIGGAMIVNTLKGIKEGTENLPPEFSSAINAAIKMMRSKRQSVRNEGFELARYLTNGYFDGQTGVWEPALRATVDDSIKLLRSGNKRHQQVGREQMIALAKGIIEDGPEVWGMDALVVENALTELQKGNSAHWAVGANMILSVADGMAAKQWVAYQTARTIAQNIANTINSVMSYMNNLFTTFGGEKPFGGDIKAGEILKAGGVMTPKAIARKYAPPGVTGAPRVGGVKADRDKSSGGSGGGGGKSGGSKSGGDEQSPLERALEVARNAADMVAALREVEGYNVKAMVKRSMGGLAEAMKLAMQITYKEAKDFSKGKLQKVATFSEAIGTVADAISGVTQAFLGIHDFSGAGRKKVESVIKGARTLVTEMAQLGKKFKTRQLVDATMFAEAVSPVVEAFGSTIEAFRTLDEQGYAGASASLVKKIMADMRMAVNIMANESKGIKREALDSATTFAEAVSPVMDAIGTTVEAFAGIAAYTSPLPQLMDQVMADMRDSIKRMVKVASSFSLSTEEWEKVSAFADTVNKVMEALSATWEAHNKTVEFVSQFRVVIDPDIVFGQMKDAIDQMIGLASGFSLGEIERLDAVASAAGNVANAIEAFFSIGRNASQDPDTLGRMVLDAVNAMVVVMDNFTNAFYGYGYDIVKNFGAGLAAGLADVGASAGMIVVQDGTTLTIEHVVRDPDGVLRNASASEVADLLNGNEFISNLQGAIVNQ